MRAQQAKYILCLV